MSRAKHGQRAGIDITLTDQRIDEWRARVIRLSLNVVDLILA